MTLQDRLNAFKARYAIARYAYSLCTPMYGMGRRKSAPCHHFFGQSHYWATPFLGTGGLDMEAPEEVPEANRRSHEVWLMQEYLRLRHWYIGLDEPTRSRLLHAVASDETVRRASLMVAQ